MADLRIVDAPLLSTVKGTEKIPTGGEGNFSISVNQVADFAKLKWFLATEGYVNNAIGNVQTNLNLHKNSVSNPHQVTKAQVGLSNVNNTADLDKPVSNATQSAIITANSGKADKVDLTASKISSDGGQTQQVINDFGGAKWYAKVGGYELVATVKLDNGDIVKSTIPNNTNDPNVDMTGWVNEYNTLLNEFSSLKTIKPQFVETLLSFGKYGIGTPSGVANYTGGNYVLTVSGSKGNNFVTVNSGNISHAGATAKWAAVIQYADGSFGTYQVQGYVGNQLNIYPALDHNVSNAKLGNIHDSVFGQHYTELGYKAFAQHIYNFNAKYALRDKFIAQFYGNDTAGSWVTIGSPTLTYNWGVSPSGDDNLMKSDFNRQFTVKANAENEGVSWEVALSNVHGYVEINAGLSLGTSATIEFYLDDILKETRTIGLVADRFIFEYANYSKGKILIKAGVGTTIRIGRTVWWDTVGKSETLITASASKIAYMGDSWGTYHNAANPNEILRLHKLVNPSATLLNQSQGGMTTQYAVAWIDYVLAQKPDVVIIEYFTNDSNCINGASTGMSFFDPDGNTQNTFVTRADYFNNLAILASKCIEAKVQPIFIMPAVLESQLQTQYHSILAKDVGRGASLIPQQLKLQSIDAAQVDAVHLYADTIETKTLINTSLNFITSYFGAIFKPRQAVYGDNAIFQVQNHSGIPRFQVIADELLGNKMPSLRLTGTYAEQGLKLLKSQIVDSILTPYGGSVLRIKGFATGDLKAIQVGENSAKVEFLAPTIPFIASALPSASQANRGQAYLIQGGTGIADKLHICIKNASEGYEWKEL